MPSVHIIHIIKSYILTSLIGLFFFCSAVNGSEVDSYTHAELLREDATEVINSAINTLIDQAVVRANREDVTDPVDLYQIINDVLGGLFVTNLENVLENSNDRRILKVDINKSIYAGFSTLWAPTIALSKRIGGVFRIQDSIIGTDKLGHFISQGYTYFEECYLKGEGVEKAILYGINSELTYYGLYSTGVFSFGDLAANFQGMRFWNDLLVNYPDILGETEKPYIAYKNGKWTVKRPVDMRRYFDIGWDERLNKNIFRNQEIADEVNIRIARTGAFIKPLSYDIYEVLKKRYMRYYVYILNPGEIPVEFVGSLCRELKMAKKKAPKIFF